MIRFGIVGTGRISDWVLRGAVQDPRFVATAICSRSEESAMNFVATHQQAFPGGAKIFTSVEEMASSDEIDAVYIGTPNSTHCDYTITCLRHAKHVLCEKPLGCSTDEVRRMIEASRQSGKALMEAMISTLNPCFRAARERISEIGPIRLFTASFNQYSTKYEALKSGVLANSFDPQMGGGAIGDVGIYTTFPTVALFGRPESVTGTTIEKDSPHGRVNLQGTVEMKYPGMIASLSYSKIVDSHIPTEICGENGNIVLDNIHDCNRAELLPHAAPTSGRGPGASATLISEGKLRDTYFYEFEEFMNLIDRNAIESKINSHEVSLINMEVMEAAIKK